MSFTRAFTASAMCSPSRASFLTGTYPSRHGVTLTMTVGDLFPDRRHTPEVLRTVAAAGGQRRGTARAAGRGVPARQPADRAQERQRAAAGGRSRHARQPAARARLPRGLQGQMAPVQAARRAPLDGRRLRADRARLRVRRVGAARRRWRCQGGHLRRRQRWDHAGGLGRGLHASDGALAGARRPAGALLPRVLAGEPARRAGLPVLISGGRLLAGGVRRPGGAAATHDRRGPARQAHRALADEARADGVHRRPGRPAGPAGLRGLLRPPAPGRGREDRPPARGAGGRPRLAAIADDDRARLRSRRARPLARRA